MKRPRRDDTGTPATGETDSDTDADADGDTDADRDTDTDADTDLASSGGSGGPLGAGSEDIGTSAYSYFAPDCLDGATDVSVVFTMHGSGGNGGQMVNVWESVAEEWCFLVVGLDSETGSSWNFQRDVDNFAALYDRIDGRYDVARHYLHGYSAGAHWSYIIGISNSDVFTGMGVFAGSLSYAERYGYWPDATEVPIPVAIAHGTADTTVPYEEAEHAYEELTGAGWPVDLYTIDGGSHAYDVSCEDRAVSFWWESW